MAIPPGVLKPTAMHARLCARYHLQLEILDRDVWGERGSIRACVRRLFRRNGTLALGDEVKFELWVRPSPGATLSPDFPWVSPEELEDLARDLDDLELLDDASRNVMKVGEIMTARYVEAFLERTRGHCSLASGEFSISVIKELSDTPFMRVPRMVAVEAAWEEHFGFPMPPCGPFEELVEEEAVIELRDQDGMKTSSPSHFLGWLKDMKPGDFLTFVHKDGGRVVVELLTEGLISADDPLLAQLGVSLKPLRRFLVQCFSADGEVLAQATRREHKAVQIIEQYIRGNTSEVVAQIRRVEA